MNGKRHDGTLDSSKKLFEILVDGARSYLPNSCANAGNLLDYHSLDSKLDVAKDAFTAYQTDFAANSGADVSKVVAALKEVNEVVSDIATDKAGKPIPGPIASFQNQANAFIEEAGMTVRPVTYRADVAAMQASVGKFDAAVEAMTNHKAFKVLDAKLDRANIDLGAISTGLTAATPVAGDPLRALVTKAVTSVNDVISELNPLYAAIHSFNPNDANPAGSILSKVASSAVQFLADASMPILPADLGSHTLALNQAWTSIGAGTNAYVSTIDLPGLVGDCAKDILHVLDDGAGTST